MSAHLAKSRLQVETSLIPIVHLYLHSGRKSLSIILFASLLRDLHTSMPYSFLFSRVFRSSVFPFSIIPLSSSGSLTNEAYGLHGTVSCFHMSHDLRESGSLPTH